MDNHRGRVLYSSGEVKVIECVHCGFSHVYPLPSSKSIKTFYEQSFYQDHKTSYFLDYERDHDWWKMHYEWLLDEMDKHHKSLKKSSVIRLIDIGSGPGLFLHVAGQRGINAFGIEPSKEAIEYSKGKYKCNVIHATFEEYKPHRTKFDWVHSSLVLEHVLDPLKFLKKTNAMMNKGGLVSIIVPNDFNPVQLALRELGKTEWWVSPFEHLNYFNRKSLRKIMEKSGFEVVHESVTFPIDLFLLMGRDYLADPSMGKECHGMRKAFEHNIKKSGNEELLRKLYGAFSKVNLGRELILIGRKKL